MIRSQADYYDVPHGEMLFAGKDEDKEDTGSLMDTTVNNAVLEYGFPVEFFLDMLSRYDASVTTACCVVMRILRARECGGCSLPPFGGARFDDNRSETSPSIRLVVLRRFTIRYECVSYVAALCRPR